MTRFTPKSLPLSALLIGFALPAAAQEACGLDGADGQWIGGSEAQSNITSADTHREQMALVIGGGSYTSLFTLSEPTSVRVEAQGRGAGDPRIDLFDETGGIVASDDDSGGNGAARAEVDLEPGTYCMATSSYDGSPMTAFVRVARTEQEPLTDGIDTTSTDIGTETRDGDVCENAVMLGALTDGLSHEGSVNDAPYLQFELTSPQAISLTAENEDADPTITLFDGTGSYLAENDDYDGLNSRIDMEDPLEAGIYCIGVDALNDTALSIAVNVAEYDPEAALAALINRGEAAPPMDGSVEIADLGVIETRLRRDTQTGSDVTWFSLRIGDPGLLLVEAIDAQGGDPWLVIYDDLGRQVGLNDDFGDGLDSLVTSRVSTGTYLVGVRQVGSDNSLVRLVFERYVPAK